METPTSRTGGIVIFSGGSAANSLVDVFSNIADRKKCPLSYVIPISDNGGSSSELIRVFGGPGIGDLRSRLVRLIPSSTPEKAALKILFNHRLSSSPAVARDEWLAIVEATHSLWDPIPSEKKELIRSFFNFLNLELVKRIRPSSAFNFQSASLGNLFLTGARLFSGSLESAVYLLRSITGVPDGVDVLPAVNTNFTLHISAGLEDGSTIVGQNSISHPSLPTALPNIPFISDTSTPTPPLGLEPDDIDDLVEDANLPGSLPTLRGPNIAFSKAYEQDLPARISRIWYINPYGQEIRPAANPAVLSAIRRASVLIYSPGSLYTSIVPCLVLKGVGPAVVDPGIRVKVLVLNGSGDRETGPLADGGLDALGFVRAIAGACGLGEDRIGLRGVVTHVVHLEGEGVPRVDREGFAREGIECVRIYGRREGGSARYDGAALGGALEAIVGRADNRRRYTMTD
ncbi:MAG: hypothetical protein M1814_004137 [Vezdaea aestivalis]|nr:MAG: hypothetical protein M1814_004137 [Vezdaea aestivalis]